MRPALRRLWSRYLAVEREGYRAHALAALSDLLDAVESITDRDQLAEMAYRARERHGFRRVPLREPLNARVLRPYVHDHITDPQALWWAMDTRTVEYEQLERFAEYDRVGGAPRIGAITYALSVTGEPRWWCSLLDARISIVEFGTHHLHEGRGVVDGSVADYLVQLCAAVAVADQAPVGAITPELLDDLVEQWSLLRDWVRYDAQGHPGGDFPAWCRARGSRHWVARRPTTRRTYYYSD